MIKINVQLFGGRGANSGYGQGTSTGGGYKLPLRFTSEGEMGIG